jgi:hypothetical protein
METPNRKLLEAIAKNVFPEQFKLDPQGTLILAFKWWREYVQEFSPDQGLDRESTSTSQATCMQQQSSS